MHFYCHLNCTACIVRDIVTGSRGIAIAIAKIVAYVDVGISVVTIKAGAVPLSAVESVQTPMHTVRHLKKRKGVKDFVRHFNFGTTLNCYWL